MKATAWNDHWFCKHLNTDEAPIPVRVPDDAMLREPRTHKALGGLNVAWFEGADYSYTKSFELTEQQLSGTLVLEFEGVYRKAEVFVNGEKAGFRPYGYTNFYVDLLPFAKVGENTIEVRAYNADQPNSRWYSGAGIYRPVQLWTAPKEHIAQNGVKIQTLSLEPATVEVRVKTTGSGPVKVELLDGETVQKLQEVVKRVPVAPHVIQYAATLARMSRPKEPDVPDFVKELVGWGAGPRAGISLITAAKAWAILHGRHHCTMKDVEAIAMPVLRHRVITTFAAEAAGVTSDDLVNMLLKELKPTLDLEI